MNEKMIKLSEELLQYNNEFLNTFLASKERANEVDFNVVVKPFADEVKTVNDRWYEGLNNWIDQFSPKHFNKKQADSIHEQIQGLSVQCFYPKTSKTKFLNTNRTIEYFLTGLMKELKRE